MKKNLFAFLTLTLSISALTFVVSCGEDDEVTPNTEQNGNQNEQSGKNGNNDNQYVPTAPIIVTVDADGKADGGHRFVNIDGESFYIDDIKYTASKESLIVTGYNDAFFDGEAKIISQLNYGRREMQVKKIDKSAFYNCTWLTSVTIPEGVTSIEKYAFSCCKNLTSVTIPSSVTSIGKSAFYGCTGLTDIYINDLAGWCNIAFLDLPFECAHHFYYKGEEIHKLVIPESVTSIGKWAFYNCIGLTSVIIPESVTSIESYAFYGCTGLTSVNIPSSVTSIGDWTFVGCTGSIDVHITDLSAWCKISFGDNPFACARHLYFNEEEIRELVIPSSVTAIGSWPFFGCTSLISLTIPSTVTSIKEGAFSGCTGLTSIIVADDNSYFDSRDNCNAIIETNSNKLIVGCNNTIIPPSVTSIGNWAFIGCTGLTSLVIPSSVTAIGTSAFSSCSSLTSMTIPEGVTSIGYSAFSACTGLTSVTIPSTVSSIESQAFYNCTRLSDVYITDLEAWCNILFGSSVFGYAHHLYLNGEKIKDLIIPSSVTSIGDWAFSSCTDLTSVTFPSSVTSIGDWAFRNCISLTDVYCYAETVPRGYDSFFDSPIANATLHVPTAAIDTYKRTEPWSQFGSIVAIE